MILDTQRRLHKTQEEIRTAEKHLERLRKRLQVNIEEHREQIRESLKSPDPEEKLMAQRVAAYWEVSLD